MKNTNRHVMSDRMLANWVALIRISDPRCINVLLGQLFFIIVIIACFCCHYFIHLVIWQSVLTWLIGMTALGYFVAFEYEVRFMRRCHRAMAWCMLIVLADEPCFEGAFSWKVAHWLHCIMTEVLERQMRRTNSLYNQARTASCLLYLEGKFNINVLECMSIERALSNCEVYCLPQDNKMAVEL